MSIRLFVGGLSWNTTDEGLRRAFEAYGDIVEAVIPRDRETGRSRGFGFVTFELPEAAEKAVEELEGTHLDGREIRVHEAEERRGPRGSSDRR